ncbi:MAG: DUF1272 domain-containing protein [Pseudomonadales bacterium]|jgi:hypothetical protein|nr:DUF1272 domain-containing protein [Pseudomonadales bacterium]
MLAMKPSCERCDRALPADAPGAFICSYECTFCGPCREDALHGRCPNCRGELLPRPRRSTERTAPSPTAPEAST